MSEAIASAFPRAGWAGRRDRGGQEAGVGAYIHICVSNCLFLYLEPYQYIYLFILSTYPCMYVCTYVPLQVYVQWS